MEAVKAFDAEWKKQNSWNFLMNRVCGILCFAPGAILMLLPVDTDIWTPLNSMILLIWAMHFYLMPYMRYVENGRSVSLYAKLKWMPVSKKEFLAVRRGYLLKFCLKTGGCIWILQQIGACLARTWGAENALFPLVFTGFMYLVGIFDINRNLCQ